MPAPTSPPSKLPFVVFLLTLGTFLMNTTEFMIAGLLPEMAADFDVSLSTTALLITAFAMGMIVGAPVMSVATLRFPGGSPCSSLWPSSRSATFWQPSAPPSRWCSAPAC